MTAERDPRDRLLHDLMNQLGVVIGFTGLLLEHLPKEDPRRADAEEIQEAARAAVAIAEQLAKPGGAEGAG